MTQSPNETLARMMGLERNCCPRCGSAETCTEGEWPDFANDANWAVKLWEWLAITLDKTICSMSIYFAHSIPDNRGRWFVDIADADGSSVFECISDSFCEAITAAGLWYNETKGGAK